MKISEQENIKYYTTGKDKDLLLKIDFNVPIDLPGDPQLPVYGYNRIVDAGLDIDVDDWVFVSFIPKDYISKFLIELTATEAQGYIMLERL